MWFMRLVHDIRPPLDGLSDLIRFRPAQRRYDVAEVKGPSDRFHDNQIRWLAYCS
jgi:hypothetical protein